MKKQNEENFATYEDIKMLSIFLILDQNILIGTS